jgi:hypothetical protein
MSDSGTRRNEGEAGMRRRTFLRFTLGGSLISFLSVRRRALAAGLSSLSVDGAKQAIVNRIKQTVFAPHKPADIRTGPFTAEVLRTEDLLNLRFEFENLTLDSSGAHLQRIDKNKTAYIRVVFPPQHIAERATSENVTPPRLPVGAHIAGESRLVFRLPSGTDKIPYDLPTILSWQQWTPSLASNATPPQYESVASAAQDAILANRSAGLNTHVGGYTLQLPRYTGGAKAGTGSYRVMLPGEYNRLGNLQRAYAPRIRSFKAIKPKKPSGPGPNQTAIEAPTSLILSPHRLSAWAHASQPVRRLSKESKKKVMRTELWHTRLGVRGATGADGKATVDEDNSFLRTVRAIWSTDYATAKAGDQKCGSSSRTEPLTAGERYQIVRLSSDLKLKNGRPVQANHLILSSLGSWLDLRGDWQQSGFDLESWTHRATMGRDQFVRVVCKGYLFPFGHRASLITITERRAEEKPAHAAYLRFYQFVVVREPEKQYSKEPTDTSRDAVEGRQIPFKTVRLKTLSTPHLNPMPDKADGWLQVDKRDFLFKIEAEDWDGRRCEFTAPLNFVAGTVAEARHYSFFHFARDPLAGRLKSYNSTISTLFRSRRERPLAGQKVAFAPSKTPGDTSFETDRLVFGAQFRDKPQDGELRFFPVIQSAKVRLAAASQLTGNNSHINFSLYKGFVSYGFGEAKNLVDQGKKAVNQAENIIKKNSEGEVFAAVADAVPLNFPNHQAGGIASPNIAIRGLSRKLGILGGTVENDFKNDIESNAWYQDLNALAAGDLSNALKPGQLLKNGKAVAESYFNRFFHDAKVLGSISLGDIVTLDYGGGKNIPRFQSVPKYDASGELKAIHTIFSWNPTVKDTGPFKARRVVESVPVNASFSIDTVTVFPLDGSKAYTTTTGELRNFSLLLLPVDKLNFVQISFASVRFVSRDGQKPDFSASGTKVEFLGALEFVNTLEKYIGGDNGNKFSDPPSLHVGSDGIQIGYSLGIPDVTAGAFSLQDMSLAAGLKLPFTGAPLSLNFAFCDRDNPFTITYLIFGGGGFFGITVGTDGLHIVEASLEFGGNCALNLGVASGKAYFMVGIYFRITKKKNGKKDVLVPDLSGYVRSGAALEVLGLIAVSVQFRFDLDYQPASGSASGTGTLTVEVDVAFFSKSVDLTIHKQFAGAPPKKSSQAHLDTDPSVAVAWLDSGDSRDVDEWCDEYCAAFGGEAA